MNTLYLESLLKKHKDVLSSINFAKQLFESLGEVHLYFYHDKLLALYGDIHDKITDLNPNHGFIEKGIELLKQYQSSDAFERYRMPPYYVYKLRNMIESLDMTTPDWLPKVHQLNGLAVQHQYTYVFDFSTVDVDCISTSHRGFFMSKLTSNIQGKESSSHSAVSSANEVSPKPQQETSTLLPQGFSEREVAIENDEREEVEPMASINRHTGKTGEFGLSVARKFLSLQKSAEARGIEFDLSIERLAELCSNKTCYFSKETMTFYAHDSSELRSGNRKLPDNYLTIDRLDSDKGYIDENVVACTHSMNQLKDQMTKEEFEHAMAVRTIMANKNFTPAQLALIAGNHHV